MNQNDKKHKVRDYREAPFAYQDKPALRYMRDERYAGRISADMFRNLRTMYVALTELASDKASQTIEASNKKLLVYSGLKDWRTIKKCLDKLEEWAFIAVTKVRGENARFKPRTITLLSVLHLARNGRRSSSDANQHGKQSAPDGEDIEVKELKEIKENYKENNGGSENLQKIRWMKADLVAKMSMKSGKSSNQY